VTRFARTFVLLLGMLFAAVTAWPAAASMPIQEVVGASGVKAWLVEDHSLAVVTLRFAFPGGAALDQPGRGGTAAMTAALLDEGAGPYDTVQYHQRLDDLAGELSFSAGHESFDGGLRMLKRNLKETVELLRLALSEPHFAPEAIERIRADTLASLSRQARNPRSLSGRLWMRDAFEDHPYGSSSEGTETSVAGIARADLAGFVAASLHRNGLVIGAVGDVTADELRDVIDKVFGSLPAGDPAAQVADAKPGDDGALVISRSPVPQSVVTFGQTGPKRDDPEWYAALVLNDILGGGGFRGRLMKEIREKRGLAYGVSTALMPFRHAGLILGSVASANDRVAESVALIRSEWQRMHDDGPTQAELDDTKTYLAGSFPLGLDSTQHIAAVLVQIQEDKLGIDYLDRRAALIGAVTLDQARALARKLFDPAKLSFAVVGDPQNLKSTRPAPESAE
jgi:zinc protease